MVQCMVVAVLGLLIRNIVANNMSLYQYVAFAGLAAILNLFVRARKLRTENEGAVLGIDRSRQEGSPTSGVVE